MKKIKIVSKLHFMGEIILETVFLDDLPERGLTGEGAR